MLTPPSLLYKINDPSYKPKFIKFFTANKSFYVNTDFMCNNSIFFKDLLSEIPIENNAIEIEMDNDDLLTYFSKMIHNDYTNEDMMYIFKNNRKIIYLLFNDFDKYGMKSICDNIKHMIFSDEYYYDTNKYHECTHYLHRFVDGPYHRLAMSDTILKDLIDFDGLLNNNMEKYIIQGIVLRIIWMHNSFINIIKELICKNTCHFCLSKLSYFVHIKSLNDRHYIYMIECLRRETYGQEIVIDELKKLRLSGQ